MTKYNLVNPCIGGSIKTQYEAKSHMQAAKDAWEDFSQYLTNSVPKFAYTLERTSDGKLFHFSVNEKIGKNKNASFSINELNVGLSNSQLNSLKSDFNNMQNKLDGQFGGKKHRYDDDNDKKHKNDEEDDSSSSSSDLVNAIRLLKYKQQNQPIVYWWYNPLIYRTNDLYIPTFISQLSPYVHINLNSSFMG
jgi:hypothetical protein